MRNQHNMDAIYDYGQGTNDKSIDLYDQDTDTYTNVLDSEYANEQSMADAQPEQTATST